MAELEGKVNAALTTGIIGTAGVGLAALNNMGGLGNIFGGCNNNCHNNGNADMNAAIAAMALANSTRPREDAYWNVNHCAPISENQCVNRYELGLAREIDALKSSIALRDANTYTDQKLLEVYKYFDGKVEGINAEICAQRVHNQRTEDSFGAVSADIHCVRNEFDAKLAAEKAARCCGDNAIVNYVNSTFYPRQIADIATEATSTASALYNPVKNCGCDCNG